MSPQHTDELFEALSDERRRFVLTYVSEHGPTSLYELSDSLTEEVDSTADTRSVTTELYHVHLPKLETAGLIDYDPVSHTVEPAGMSDSRVMGLLNVARSLGTAENEGDTQTTSD